MTKKRFEPNKENCTVCIKVHHETEKAYAVYAGNNGRITGNREWYEFIAKSICYVDDNGNVFAPSWATKGIPFSEIVNDIDSESEKISWEEYCEMLSTVDSLEKIETMENLLKENAEEFGAFYVQMVEQSLLVLRKAF